MVKNFGAQTWEPACLGLNPTSARHSCVALGRCLDTLCLSFPMYKMGIRTSNRITSLFCCIH